MIATLCTSSDSVDSSCVVDPSFIAHSSFDFCAENCVITILKMLRNVMALEPSQGTSRPPVFCQHAMTMAVQLAHNEGSEIRDEVVCTLPGSHNMHFAVHVHRDCPLPDPLRAPLRPFGGPASGAKRYELVYRYVNKFTGLARDEPDLRPASLKRSVQCVVSRKDVDVSRKKLKHAPSEAAAGRS